MLTLTGNDARHVGEDGNSVGNIVTVAGAMTRRTIAQNTYVHLDILEMDIRDNPAVPALSAGGYAAAATLLLLGAGYFLRRRFTA